MVQVNDVQILNSIQPSATKNVDLEKKILDEEKSLSVFTDFVTTSKLPESSTKHVILLENKLKEKKEELAMYKKDWENGTDRGMEKLVEEDVRQIMEDTSFFVGLDTATAIVGGIGSGLLINDLITNKSKKTSLAVVAGAFFMFVAKHLSKLLVPKVLAKQRTTEGSSLNNFYKDTLPSRIKHTESEILRLERELTKMGKPKLV